jgi:hypothetical protein
MDIGVEGYYMNLFIFLMLFSTSVFAQSKIAVVKILRGEVTLLTLGKSKQLNVDDWVENGGVVKTAEKSFVKLIFIDKSQMNIGPNSEMKVESFTGKNSGIIDLVKGKIRSQVTKDYLQMKDKDKSKLFIKTKNAVMGVRGTDFLISSNGQSTSIVLFEGEIAFNKFENRGEISTEKLEEIVDRGVRMFPGEFSVVDPARSMPTVPALMNIQQREKLEQNVDMNKERAPSSSQPEEVSRTVVPPGLSGAVVSNNPEVLKKELSQVNIQDNSSLDKRSSSSDPEGYVKGEKVKPANGSFVHIESGVIIPPGPDSVLDKNSNTYIPGSESGRVASDGSYIPPKNIEITDKGTILVSTTVGGNVKAKEVPPPVPIVTPRSPTLGQMGQSDRSPAMNPGPNGGHPNQDIPLPGFGGVDNRFHQNGGISNVNDPTRNGFSNTTINVGP